MREKVVVKTNPMALPISDIHAAALTDRNPRVAAEALFEKIKADGTTPFPKVYIACGTEFIFGRQIVDLLTS
jgi:hypothetical protein